MGESEDTTVYILAATHAEAREIAHRAGRKWVHLHYPEQLRGVTNPEVWKTKCWPPPRWAGWPSINALVDVLRSRSIGWTIVNCPTAPAADTSHG